MPQLVTPSRVCELKCQHFWTKSLKLESHPHGCVSWNFKQQKEEKDWKVTLSRVCELKYFLQGNRTWVRYVTPSRVCELKYVVMIFDHKAPLSHPHGCVSWNSVVHPDDYLFRGHTLTGVWVEISYPQSSQGKASVTPSRVCTENYDNFQIADLHPLRPKYKAKANHNHILMIDLQYKCNTWKK